MLKNREAEILAKTYKDRMTVSRKVPETDEDTQETVMKDVPVHEDVKCALSTSGLQAPQKDDENHRHTTEDNFIIFAMPEILCEAGDKAVIVTKVGQTYIGTCGRSMGYESHSETPFIIERVV